MVERKNKKHLKKDLYKAVVYNSILQMDHYKYLLEKIASKTTDLGSIDRLKFGSPKIDNEYFGPDANVDLLLKVIRATNTAMIEIARINMIKIEEFELKDSPLLYISNT